MSDTVYYAIGDVHGEAERLARLHEAIFADVAAHGARACVVHLGDLIDRGPESRACVMLAMAMESAGDDIAGVTLRGNHEDMMVRALLDGEDRHVALWLRNGGDATIDSYLRAAPEDVEDWRDAITPNHLAWMARCETLLHRGGLVFVHAGIDPDTFPAPDPAIHLWTRAADFFDDAAWPDRPPLSGLRVIHGHTPTDDFAPEVTGRRINVDTGAAFGGPVTAAVLVPGEAPRFLSA